MATSQRGAVLIVEDDILLAMEIEEALVQAAFVVLPLARNVVDALEVARLHRPSIALVDIALPGGRNGIDLALQLNEELNIRSIFVSGHSDAETVAAASSAQPISWLKKPFGPGSIVASVELALRD